MLLQFLAKYLCGRRGRLEESVFRDAGVLEMLEERIAPAVLASVQGGTLKIVGDDANNEIALRGDETSSGTFVLSSPSVEINGAMEEVVLTGVKNISIRMGNGYDTVIFDGESPVVLDGWLKIDGGGNMNSITATNLSVGGDLKVFSNDGLKNSGGTKSTFTDLVVGGDLIVQNGLVHSTTDVVRSEGGTSGVEGDIRLLSKSKYGSGDIRIVDTNVGGDVVGKGSGAVSVANVLGSGTSIGGDLIFNGSGSVLCNTEVMGDVRLRFDGFASFSSYERAPGLPAIVHGDVSVKTAKAFYDTLWSGGGGVIVMPGYEEPDRFLPQGLTFSVGGSEFAGLQIGGDLSISGNHGRDYVNLNNLKVSGDTAISLGNGANTAMTTDSHFSGSVLLKCGRDFDETNFGFSGKNVTFGSEPKIDLGKQERADGGLVVGGTVLSSYAQS